MPCSPGSTIGKLVGAQTGLRRGEQPVKNNALRYLHYNVDGGNWSLSLGSRGPLPGLLSSTMCTLRSGSGSLHPKEDAREQGRQTGRQRAQVLANLNLEFIKPRRLAQCQGSTCLFNFPSYRRGKAPLICPRRAPGGRSLPPLPASLSGPGGPQPPLALKRRSDRLPPGSEV